MLQGLIDSAAGALFALGARHDDSTHQAAAQRLRPTLKVGHPAKRGQIESWSARSWSPIPRRTTYSLGRRVATSVPFPRPLR
jgi:hypothetical protein